MTLLGPQRVTSFRLLSTRRNLQRYRYFVHHIYDSTPSGGWINGAVILGDTGIGMSVRGEQFWLDKTRAAQLRPRARPRYTLTPSIVLRDGQPFMAIGTPGGDNQDQTILQAFLNV